MYRTFTINLNGIVFHVDERAYGQLDEYLKSVRKYFENTEGKDEIMSDIEARIAEIFQSKVNEKRQVILPEDVEEIISILGKPQDIAGQEETSEGNPEKNTDTSRERKTRRLYRDPDNKVLGGVCSGLGYYFNLDPVWIRILFVLTWFIAGTGILVYLILWLVVPAAKTTSEKLDMKGENFDLSDIEKNIKEDLKDLKERVKNAGKGAKTKAREGFDQVRNNLKDRRDSGAISEILYIFIRIAAVFAGMILLIIAIALLIGFAFSIAGQGGVFSMHQGDISFGGISNMLGVLIDTPLNQNLALTGIILVIGIPILMLILGSLRIIFRFRRIPYLSWVMSGLFIFGVLLSVFVLAQISSEFSETAQVKNPVSISQPQNGTLYLSLNDNIWEGNKPLEERKLRLGDIRYCETEAGATHYGLPHIRIIPSRSDNFSIQILKSSKGSTEEVATENANSIEYSVNSTDSTVILDKYFSMAEGKTVYRKQQVKVLIQIPKGKMIYIPSSFKKVRITDGNDEEIAEMKQLNTFWLMTDGGLICRTCNGVILTPKDTIIINTFDKVETKNKEKISV